MHLKQAIRQGFIEDRFFAKVIWKLHKKGRSVNQIKQELKKYTRIVVLMGLELHVKTELNRYVDYLKKPQKITQ